MPLQLAGQVGPQAGSDAAQLPLREGRTGEAIVSELHGRYYEQAFRGYLFVAQAIVTAPVIYTTAAGTGGPLIYNPPTSKVNVVPVLCGYGVTVVSTVAAAIGLTGNTGQTSTPTATTAIDGAGNLFLGGPVGTAKVFRVGTPTNAGGFLLPFGDLHTGALTVDTGLMRWVDLGGAMVIPPGSWGAVSASATATTTVAQIALVYEEVPV